jgi:hypothetical protein
MALTGPAGGPPQLSPGGPALAVADALARLDAPEVPGVGLLAERAAIAGFARRAPLSVGGAFRALPARDGWFGLSLARPSDVELVPALVEGAPRPDPWVAVGEWASRQTTKAAVERALLLGLPACKIATSLPPRRRAAVETAAGGRRQTRSRERLLVVDLTSLWAGPLCAHLLGLTGARVVKVESAARPDGARRGPPAFFDLLHAGHESVLVDLAQPGALRALLAAADVVLEGSRPRALRQLGIDADAYVARGTVWASITAYGRSDPDADRVGFGDDVAAAAGLIGWADGVPYPVGDAIADPLAGVFAAAAVRDALHADTGALLDVSMYDVAVHVAHLPSADQAQVVNDSVLGWGVRIADEWEPVREPHARRPTGRAPALGAHTRAVLDEVSGRPLDDGGSRRARHES